MWAIEGNGFPLTRTGLPCAAMDTLATPVETPHTTFSSVDHSYTIESCIS